MTLELAGKRTNMLYIDCPGWVQIMAMLTILASDLWKAAQPWLLDQEINTLVKYDKARRDLISYSWLWPVARVFVGCWCAFLLIELLEGVVKWLH
jgi:hypothetical protein